MTRASILAGLALCVTVAPALAAGYPVQGQWGETAGADKGAVDCAKLRVIGFNGEQRTDSKGGVPAYRNVSVSPQDAATFRIVDEFTNGQVNRGRVSYILHKTDADHIELRLQAGGTIKLHRCK